MKYMYSLTKRHEFPAEAGCALFPNDIMSLEGKGKFRTYSNSKDILNAYLDFMIPNDATEIVVFMSGLKAYKTALFVFCKARDIKLVLAYPRKKRDWCGIRTLEDYYYQIRLRGKKSS